MVSMEKAYQEGHGAIIHRRQVMQWLDHEGREADLLVTPPVKLFSIEEMLSKPVQTSLAL